MESAYEARWRVTQGMSLADYAGGPPRGVGGSLVRINGRGRGMCADVSGEAGEALPVRAAWQAAQS